MGPLSRMRPIRATRWWRAWRRTSLSHRASSPDGWYHHSIMSDETTLSQPLPYRFPKSSRLLTRNDFDRVYRFRCKAGDGSLLVFALRNDTSATRIGLSVSRKVGNAIVRNRLKRLLREAFRLTQHDLPTGLDLVVIPTAKDKATLENYQHALVRLTKKLQRRLQTPTSEPEP